MAVGGGIAGRSPKKRCRNMSFRLRLPWFSASEPSLHTIPGTHAHLPGSVADFRRFRGAGPSFSAETMVSAKLRLGVVFLHRWPGQTWLRPAWSSHLGSRWPLLVGLGPVEE